MTMTMRKKMRNMHCVKSVPLGLARARLVNVPRGKHVTLNFNQLRLPRVMVKSFNCLLSINTNQKPSTNRRVMVGGSPEFY